MGKKLFRLVARNVRNNRILLDTFLGTGCIVFLMLMFHTVRFVGDFTLFDPIGDAIGDVDFTDIVFSELRRDPPPDTSIILVNIGSLNRAGIAQQVEIIGSCQPKVIAIDGFFWKRNEADADGDARLSDALRQVPRLVMASKLLYNPSGGYDSVACSDPQFYPANSGFANLETEALEQHQYKVCRTFPPAFTIDGTVYKSFGVAIAERADPKAAHRFLARANAFETINYRGNIIDFGQSEYGGRFRALDVEDVLQRRFHPSSIKDKIVIMGYLGDDFTDPSWEDKFFTPLNKRYAGRSNPDMFGAVIHANIVSMILQGDVIDRQSQTSSYIWAILLCFANVWLFTIIYYRMPHWYDGLTKGIQVLEVLLILTLNVVLFSLFEFKTNLTLATIGVLLTSDSLEICYGVIKNLYKSQGRRQLFTLHKEFKSSGI